MLLTDDRSMPRARGTIGLYVRVLDELMKGRVADDALADVVHWLP